MKKNDVEELQALQDTLYFIGGKWRVPIMNSLCNGNKHFRAVVGVSCSFVLSLLVVSLVEKEPLLLPET